jgi:hypothetical protein
MSFRARGIGLIEEVAKTVGVEARRLKLYPPTAGAPQAAQRYARS